MGSKVGSDREVTIVVGDASPLVRRYLPDAVNAGLTETVASVLSTYREGSPDMVLDHELWLACARAVGALVGADASEVQVDGARGFLDRLLHRVPSRVFGTLEVYSSVLLNTPDSPLWQVVQWRRQGRLVAVASHEAWWRVGGPDLYADSYTSCFHVRPSAVDNVVAALQSAVVAEGGSVGQVVNLCSTRTA